MSVPICVVDPGFNVSLLPYFFPDLWFPSVSVPFGRAGSIMLSTVNVPSTKFKYVQLSGPSMFTFNLSSTEFFLLKQVWNPAPIIYRIETSDHNGDDWLPPYYKTEFFFVIHLENCDLDTLLTSVLRLAYFSREDFLDVLQSTYYEGQFQKKGVLFLRSIYCTTDMPFPYKLLYICYFDDCAFRNFKRQYNQMSTYIKWTNYTSQHRIIRSLINGYRELHGRFYSL